MSRAALTRTVLGALLVGGLTYGHDRAAAAADPIVGTWSGVLQQSPVGTSSSYASEFTFTSATSGTSRYPSLNCGGTLSGSGSGGTYRFRESITYGRATATTNGCIDGTVEIVVRGRTMTMQWEGSWDGTRYVASGTLGKQGPAGYTGKRFYRMFAKSWINGPAITEGTWTARKIQMDVNVEPREAAAGAAFDYKIYQSFYTETEFADGEIVNAAFVPGSMQQLANTTFGLRGQVRVTRETVTVSPDKTSVVFERRIEGNPHILIKAADVAAAEAIARSWGLDLPATNIKIYSVLRLTVSADGATPSGEGSAFPTHYFWIREGQNDRLFQVQRQVQPSQYFR